MDELPLHVIVRYSGERSLPLCLKALKAQTSNVTVIEVYPFINAITKTFEILEKSISLPWVLVLDADVILKNDSLKIMLRAAEKAKVQFPNLLDLYFWNIDKFTGLRHAGCHLYFRQNAIGLYNHFLNLKENKETARPEREEIKKFIKDNNLTSHLENIIVGFHDYEQFYSHIYVKFYRRAIRKPYEISKNVQEILKRREQNPGDLDYAVALYGLFMGDGKKDVPYDARNYPKTEELFSIKEKPPLPDL